MLPAALRSSALTLCVLALLSPAVMAATDKTSAGAPAADGLAGAEHSATLKRVRDTATITIVKDGKVDLECGSTTNTRERQKDVAFAYTTFVAGIKMLAKKSSNVNGIEDLRGKTVVVTKGTT